MNNNILKSIVALFAGFVAAVTLSASTDVLLTKTGIMKIPFDYNSSWFIILVIVYRSLYGTVGSYITTSLVPNKPMQYAMIGGCIRFILSIIGAIVILDAPPHWHNASLIIFALPSA